MNCLALRNGLAASRQWGRIMPRQRARRECLLSPHPSTRAPTVMLAGGTRILTALVASDPPCEPCGLVARWTPRSISAILACVPENSPASAPAPARAHARARTLFLLGVIAAVALFAALGSIRPVFDPDAVYKS